MLDRAFGAQCLLAGLVIVGGCIVVVPDDGKGGGGGGGGGGSSGSMSSDDSSYDSSSSDTSSSTTQGQPTYSVYFYRDAYRHLPDMGETKRYFRAHGLRGDVDRGYYNGDWDCGAQGLQKQGAGIGETVIDGHLEIKGSNWRLSGCTITGNLKIRGNDNDLTGCEIFGDLDVRGTGNRTP